MIGSKYNKLYPPLLERVLREEEKSKDSVKAAKTRLHQNFGAYLQGNSHKKAKQILETGICEENIKNILSLHASTKERLQIFDEFYEFINGHTSDVNSFMDLGCGFNPFSLKIMPNVFQKNIRVYHAYDIDLRTKEILNHFFEILNLPQTADCADLVVETPDEEVDLALMCKLIPVLEAQKKGRGFELANSINARFLVITYPLKSLGGREKGMGAFYSKSFEEGFESGKINNYSLVAQKKVGNELVYILYKN